MVTRLKVSLDRFLLYSMKGDEIRQTITYPAIPRTTHAQSSTSLPNIFSLRSSNDQTDRTRSPT